MKRVLAAAPIFASVFSFAATLPRPVRTRPRQAVTAKHVIWRNPGDVSRLDFAFGVGGRAHSPHPPFRFIEEDVSGSNPKIMVRDAQGSLWSVKWGEEARPEVFSSRLAWACGYIAQPEYFASSGRIAGAKGLRRASSEVAANGRFHNARFQLRTKWPKFSKDFNWSWVNNPFIGSRELNGLKVLMMLVSNWDNKDARDMDRDSNVAIFEARGHARTEYLYFIADWGASMGKWGHVFDRDKWDCRGYNRQTRDFVKGERDGFVQWGFVGQHTPDASKDIRVTDVRWLLQYLGRIRDRQLRAGLYASGASPPEVECFTGAIRSRIVQLERVAAPR